MQRRKRYEGLVWLKSLVGDPADGKVKPPTGARVTVHNTLHDLGHKYGLIVELEQRDGIYCVRCIPRNRNVDGSPFGIAASYMGLNLSAILSRACLDFAQLEESPRDCRLSPREWPRRVG